MISATQTDTGPVDQRIKRIFTLLELLVVIAMIVILMAMLLPALNKAREAGIASNCRGNLKQQVIALLQYTGDNVDSYPVLLEDGAPYFFNTAPIGMNPYLGSSQKAKEKYFNPNIKGVVKNNIVPYNGSQTFYCPARANSNAKARYIDYGTNIRGWVPLYDELKVSHLKRPSTSLFRMDTRYSAEDDFGRLNIGSMSNIHFRHNNRANTVFFDGHISGVSMSIQASMTLANLTKIE